MSIPVCVAFALLFLSLGLFANSKGLTLIEGTSLTLTLFAGPSQVFMMDNQDLSFWVVVMNVFILNFKLLLMAILVIPLWPNYKRIKIPGLFLITNSTYLLYSARPNVKDPWSYYMGISIAPYVMGVFATMAGYLLWDIASGYRSSLSALAHIILPIHFTCLIVMRKKEQMAVGISIFAIFASPFLEALLGRQYIIFAWFLIAFIAVMLEDKLCGK